MAEQDLPPQSRLMAEQDLPPQPGKILMYAAGGGFAGALLAIVVAKILSGPCCCEHAEGAERQPAAVSSSTAIRHASDRVLTA